jgi:hypothetical protein
MTHIHTLSRTRQRRRIRVVPNDELLRPAEAARLLNVTPRCLQDWRLKGTGPRFIRMTPKLVQYRRSDLEKFIEESAA